METSTIRIAIRDLPAHFDRDRIGLVLDEIGAALREERGVHAHCSADSMTIEIDVATARLSARSRASRRWASSRRQPDVALRRSAAPAFPGSAARGRRRSGMVPVLCIEGTTR